MKDKKVEGGYLVRLFPGEEVAASLLQLAESKNLPSAALSGIGGVDEIEIGYFDLKKNEYLHKTIREELEMVSLLGNLSYIDGKPFYHLHGTFGTRSFQTISGHVFRAVISITAEIHLKVFSEKITRSFGPQFQINLLDL